MLLCLLALTQHGCRPAQSASTRPSTDNATATSSPYHLSREVLREKIRRSGPVLNITAYSGDVDVLKELGAAPNVRELYLYLWSPREAGLRHVSVLPELESLHLDGVTDDDLKELTGCPKLRKLDLNCTGMTGVGLAGLARSPLEVITMLGGGSDEGLQVISTIESLREIHCSVTCTGKTLRALGRLKRLRVLNLYGVCDFSAEDLRPLVQLPELRELCLRGIAARGDTMPVVSQLSGLRALDFGADKTVNDEWLACLKNLASLERLNLASTSVTDLGVQRLAGLRHLRELDLSALPITDAGLQNLAELEKLRRLDLSDTKITAKSVAVLASMRGLREIRIWSASFSPEAVATLQRSLPDAVVEGRRR